MSDGDDAEITTLSRVVLWVWFGMMIVSLSAIHVWITVVIDPGLLLSSLLLLCYFVGGIVLTMMGLVVAVSVNNEVLDMRDD